MLIDYGLDEKTAINILKEVGWDINNAMDYYFRNGHKLQATGSTTAAASTRNAVKDIFKKYRTLKHDEKFKRFSEGVKNDIIKAGLR